MAFLPSMLQAMLAGQNQSPAAPQSPWLALGGEPGNGRMSQNDPRYAPLPANLHKLALGQPQGKAQPVDLAAALDPYAGLAGSFGAPPPDTSAVTTPPPDTGGGASKPPFVTGISLRAKGVPTSGFETDADYKALVDQLGGAGSRALDAQGAGIKTLEEHVNAMKNKELQTDLSPVLGLYDSWFGTNMQGGYARPMSADQRDERVLALEEMVQKARGDLSETDVNLLRSKLGIAEKRIESKEAGARHAEDIDFKERELQYKRESDAAMQQNALDTKLLMAELERTKQATDAGQKDRSEIDKSKTTDRVVGNIEFASALTNLGQMLEEEPSDGPLDFDRNPALKAAYTRALVSFKNAAGLGALANADLALAAGQIKDPVAFDAWFKGQVLGGTHSTAKTQIKESLKGTKQVFDQFHKQLQATYPSEGARPLLNEFTRQYESAAKTKAVQAPQVATVAAGGTAPAPFDRKAYEEKARAKLAGGT